MTVKSDCFPGIGQERGETKHLVSLRASVFFFFFFFFFFFCPVLSKIGLKHPRDSRAIMRSRTTGGELARKN